MSKSRFGHKRLAYPTDIRIPNLDAMSESDLKKFAERAGKASEKQVGAKGDWLSLAAAYARHKLKAMAFRKAGNINMALRYEDACDNFYDQIPKRMKW